MQRYFVIIALLTLFSFSAKPQTGKFHGLWQGKLNAGVELRLVFHVTDSAGVLKASADSPDQNAFGMKCDSVFVTENTITIKMMALRAAYTGKLVGDSILEGAFNQGASLPLVLKKVNSVEERKRPQTPKPPFSYRSEEVIYENAAKSLKYGATITIPEGNGPFAAALLITGSGQQDRDESLLGHKPFAVIADHLSRNGYIVLRVDDRGTGKSTGKFSKATTADFADDVNCSLNYLLTRNEVDKKRIGLIGHSEGGMIAPMVAADRKEIDFIILLAGPGIKIVDLLAEQNEAVAVSSGISAKAGKSINEVFRKISTSLITAPEEKTGIQNAIGIAERWAAKKDSTVLKELEFETSEKRKAYVLNMALQLSTPWYKYFIGFDPGSYIEKLSCKVLALNGEKDVQVLPKSNLAGIKKALKKSKAKNITLKEMPGLNHIFQKCKSCSVEEYGQLEETFSPAALLEMINWMNKYVK